MLEKSIRMTNPWLHDWSIVLDERTYGIIQHDSGVPNCTICLGTHFLDLPISAVACVACLAVVLWGIIYAAASVLCNITHLQQADAQNPALTSLFQIGPHRRRVCDLRR